MKFKLPRSKLPYKIVNASELRGLKEECLISEISNACSAFGGHFQAIVIKLEITPSWLFVAPSQVYSSVSA